MKSWVEAKTDLEATTLFLVNRTGPTVYQIKDEEDNSRRVILGSSHSCNCKEEGFCMHILFVILKVLRIPQTNALSQKSGFTDAEIEMALAGNFEERSRPKRQPLKKKKQTVEKENEESTVDRQILIEDEEEICPICQDDMKKEHALTWCRKGCGNNIHAKCMKMYAQYKSTTKKDILCPLCRENWGPMAIHIINDDCKGKASLRKACAVVTCHSCSFTMRGNFMRCLECSMYGIKSEKSSHKDSAVDGPIPVDFCQNCFKNIGRVHAKHHFITSSTNSSVRDFSWEYIKNPRTPQQLFAADFLENIQNRELTTNDYEMLLNLDRPQYVTIPNLIIDALKSCDQDDKCWCGRDVKSGTAKTLVCGHAAHVECCRVKLNEAIEEGFWKLEEIKCPHSDCDVPLFVGLARRKKKIVKASDGIVSNEGINRNSADASAIYGTPFVIAGAGLGATATGVATPLYNERSELSLNLRTGRATASRGSTAPNVDRTPSLVVQSGKLPPRRSAPGPSSRSSGRVGMRRGLALCGRGQGNSNQDIRARVIHSSDDRVRWEMNTQASGIATESTRCRVLRSNSAYYGSGASGGGTSSFASSHSKRREVRHQKDNSAYDSGVSVDDVEGLISVVSSSSLVRPSCSQPYCGSDAAPIGFVSTTTRRSVVARARGSVAAGKNSSKPNLRELSQVESDPSTRADCPTPLQTCLQVSQY